METSSAEHGPEFFQSKESAALSTKKCLRAGKRGKTLENESSTS